MANLRGEIAEVEVNDRGCYWTPIREGFSKLVGYISDKTAHENHFRRQQAILKKIIQESPILKHRA